MSEIRFTYQPFQQQQLHIFAEKPFLGPDGKLAGQIRQAYSPGDVYSLPGMGLTVIVFPRGADAGKPAYLYGPVQTSEIQPQNGIHHSFQLRMLPGVFSSVFHLPNDVLPSTGVPLELVLSGCRPFADRIAEAADLEEFDAILRQMFGFYSGIVRSISNTGTAEMMLSVAESMLLKNGVVSVSEAADALGYCRQHFSQLFLENTGLRPKQLCSQVRFQNALHMMCRPESEEVSLTDISADCGYFDQSHFNRDFAKHTGMCPRHFLKLVHQHRDESADTLILPAE